MSAVTALNLMLDKCYKLTMNTSQVDLQRFLSDTKFLGMIRGQPFNNYITSDQQFCTELRRNIQNFPTGRQATHTQTHTHGDARSSTGGRFMSVCEEEMSAAARGRSESARTGNKCGEGGETHALQLALPGTPDRAPRLFSIALTG